MHSLLRTIISAEEKTDIGEHDASMMIARLAVRDCLGQGLSFNEIILYSQKLFQMTHYKSFDLYKNEVDFYKRVIIILSTFNKEKKNEKM